MARETCFRCDWEGTTDGVACPRCGTPLYRPRTSGERSRDEPDTPRASPLRGAATTSSTPRSEYLPSSDASDPEVSISVRRRPFAAFVAVAVLLTGWLWWFLRAHELPEGTGAGGPPPPSGRLVYVSGGDGGQRLWTWDPRSGSVMQGPSLEGEVVQLVSAQGPLAGWLGVTTRDAGGVLEASILRSHTPDAHAVHVFSADLVAWGPNGTSVISAGLGDVSNGCYASLKVYRERLDGDDREHLISRSQFCGEIPALAQTHAVTYFSWEREDGTGIFALGNDGTREILDGWSLLSASPTSDLLVEPAGRRRGAALLWNEATEPDRYRGAGGGPVTVERVLAWTVAADGALVVGSVDDREGLYLLDTTAGGDREPRYVGVVREPVFATTAFDGSIYVASQGELLVWRSGRLLDAGLSEDAPRPTGPIAWIPGSGYSPT
jgi:hypothetical protein